MCASKGGMVLYIGIRVVEKGYEVTGKILYSYSLGLCMCCFFIDNSFQLCLQLPLFSWAGKRRGGGREEGSRKGERKARKKKKGE